MKRYTPQGQLRFENFETPFELHLSPENKWVKLAQQIPWDDCATIYLRALKDFGRPGIDARLAIAALVIKHLKKLSDRAVVEEISENLYLQYFAGFSSFNPKPAFDPSLFVTLRKRMGIKEFDQMNDLIIRKALDLDSTDDHPNSPSNTLSEEEEQMIKNKQNKSSSDVQTHKGRLKLDATVADQMIVYPTDLGLLNSARMELERLIDLLYKKSKRTKKPRTYRRIARWQYLFVAKKKKKHKKTIRTAMRQQLNYVRRNIKIVNVLWNELQIKGSPFTYRDLKLFWVIQLLHDQQRRMYNQKTHQQQNRIVNIYQPYVRPIPRGKDKAAIEFGAKLGVSEFQGFCRLDHLSWEAYHEGKKDLVPQVQRFKKLTGYYPKVVLVDKIYLTRQNRQWLKSKNIRHCGKKLGRPKPLSYYFQQKLKKEKAMRNHIEGKFGQGKNAYGLNQIRARRQDTSESWIANIFFVMNLVRWNKIMMTILICIWQILLFLFYSFKKSILGVNIDSKLWRSLNFDNQKEGTIKLLIRLTQPIW